MAAIRSGDCTMVAAIRVLDAQPDDDASSLHDALLAVANDCSPRVECHGRAMVVLDVDGLAGLIGPPETIGAELRRAAMARGVTVAVAVAASRVAAIIAVHARWRTSVVPEAPIVIAPGTEAAHLAPLPVTVLEAVAWTWAQPAPGELATVRAGTPAARPRRRRADGGMGHYRLAPAPTVSPTGVEGEWIPAAARSIVERPGQGPSAVLRDPVAVQTLVATLRRWGVRTLGALAALPPDELFTRLGPAGRALQRAARGEDDRPLVAAVAAPTFVAALALEWPIEGLEPLSFVFGRLFDDLAQRLAAHDRGAVRVHVQLRLVTRVSHTRLLDLPVAMRDPKVLRTLVMLDLESHPPPAGVDHVEVRLDPSPAPIVQHSLLVRAVPAPEHVSTLLARLTSLMGEGRCGTPVLVDSYRPGACALQPFHPPPPDTRHDEDAPTPSPAAMVRRFRRPVPVRVEVHRGRPVRVRAGSLVGSGVVRQSAGPWRSSGGWWTDTVRITEPASLSEVSWDADEWDVELSDGGAYRLSYARDHDRWFLEGSLD